MPQAIWFIGKIRHPKPGLRRLSIYADSSSSMETFDPNFAEFLKLLTTHRVKYLVVGGYAVADHVHLRAEDLANMRNWAECSSR